MHPTRITNRGIYSQKKYAEFAGSRYLYKHNITYRYRKVNSIFKSGYGEHWQPLKWNNTYGVLGLPISIITLTGMCYLHNITTIWVCLSMFISRRIPVSAKYIIHRIYFYSTMNFHLLLQLLECDLSKEPRNDSSPLSVFFCPKCPKYISIKFFEVELSLISHLILREVEICPRCDTQRLPGW